MGKCKRNARSKPPSMLQAPWIYISDPSPDSTYSQDLTLLIPDARHLILGSTNVNSSIFPRKVAGPLVITGCRGDDGDAIWIRNIQLSREAAIEASVNFASINITTDSNKVVPEDCFGPNHLEISAADSDVAGKIYRWLFSVFTVSETLYLIPEEQMKRADNSLPGYEYCPLSENNSRPKDAKIYFTVLVLSKPQVIEGKQLMFEVADHTGVAKLCFQYRGKDSQIKWDKALTFNPGERRTFPRIPMIQIKERKRTRLLKAPVRLVACIVTIPGLALLAVSTIILEVAKQLHMAPYTKWVAEADIGPDGKVIDWNKPRDGTNIRYVMPTEKRMINVFNEKGELTWSDGASLASTDVGNDADVKLEKDVV